MHAPRLAAWADHRQVSVAVTAKATPFPATPAAGAPKGVLLLAVDTPGVLAVPLSTHQRTTVKIRDFPIAW